MIQVYLDHTALCALVSRSSALKASLAHSLELGLRRAQILPITSSHSLMEALKKLSELAPETFTQDTEEQISEAITTLCDFVEPSIAELAKARQLSHQWGLRTLFALEAALVLLREDACILSACPEAYAAIPFLSHYEVSLRP